MKSLFGKYEFVIAGNLQPVFFAGMLDNQHPAAVEKLFTSENAARGRREHLSKHPLPSSARSLHRVSFQVVAQGLDSLEKPRFGEASGEHGEGGCFRIRRFPPPKHI